MGKQRIIRYNISYDSYYFSLYLLFFSAKERKQLKTKKQIQMKRILVIRNLYLKFILYALVLAFLAVMSIYDFIQFIKNLH